jgi:hypothetical protein
MAFANKTAEPVAKTTLTPAAVKEFCNTCSLLTNEDKDGNIPLTLMSHDQLVELASNLDDFRDRLSDVNHPEHTRIVSWAQNRAGSIKILFTAINTTRKMISEVDETIAPRAKAVDTSLDVVNSIFNVG